MEKECIILAGGFGTRLQSVVKDLPKCMAEVAGKPFLCHLFDYLSKEHFEHIILSLGYKSDVVIEWLDKNSFPFDISYVIETSPLGTGGALKFAQQKARSENQFVMNGDTFFSIDTMKFIHFHKTHKWDISLALKPMTDFDRYGSVGIDEHARIVQFREKQFCENGLINGGIYLISKNIFDQIEEISFSFEKEILEKRLQTLKIGGFEQDSYFIDIGIPSDYEKANIDLKPN